MSIPLTKQQITDLQAINCYSAVIGDYFTTFTELEKLGIDKFNQASLLLKLGLDYNTALAAGYFSNLELFQVYLRVSPVYRLAALASRGTPAIRKLFFELNYWISSEVGAKSPALVIACWQELITLTKGTLVAQLTNEQIKEWNDNITLCKMNEAFKLTKI